VDTENKSSGVVRVEETGAVTRIYLDLGGLEAPLNQSHYHGLLEALKDADGDAECQAVVLVGLDARIDPSDVPELYQDTFFAIEALRPVTIALDGGGTVQDGPDLTLACDLVIAANRLGTGMAKISWAMTPNVTDKTKLTKMAAGLPAIESELMAALAAGADQRNRHDSEQAKAKKAA